MSLYFVTGISGSGKSAVCMELKSRGYESYDTDDDGLSKWQNVTTGYIHPKSSVKSEDRTDDFLRSHRWNVSQRDVEELAKNAAHKSIFLCGVAGNVDELKHSFKSVFALIIDEEAIKNRLANRTNNSWGKQAHELALTLKQLSHLDQKYKTAGYIVIDASQPVARVVDEILARSNV